MNPGESMAVGHGEIGRYTLALGKAEDLGRGEVHDPRDVVGLGGREHVPGAQDVGRQDDRRCPPSVVGNGAGMNDGVAAIHGLQHRCVVAKVVSVAEIKTAYLPPGGLQHGANGTTDLPSRPSQQDSTHLIIVTVRLPPSQPQNAPGHRPRVPTAQ